MAYRARLIAWILIVGFAWSEAGLARPFVESNANEPHAKAYLFVTSKILDPVDRAACPIRVDYVPLEGYVGFTPLKAKSDECPDVIQITSRFKHDWKSGLVMAHELTHVFRHARNPNELPWLDEGLAKLVEHQYLGIGPITLHDELATLDEFALETDQQLYRDNSPAYATSYFFALYLYNHLGGDAFLKEIMASPLGGWEAIESAALNLRAQGVIKIDRKHLTRDSLWTHFAFALLLNDSRWADHDLFKLDQRYRAIKDTKTKLLRVSDDSDPKPGWRIRYFRWPLKTEDLSRLHDSSAALYLVKAGPDFKVQTISRKSSTNTKSPPSGPHSSFDYLIAVSLGD